MAASGVGRNCVAKVVFPAPFPPPIISILLFANIRMPPMKEDAV